MIEKYLFLCDQKKCKKCSYPECKHTTDIKHAKNKTDRKFISYGHEMSVSDEIQYWEVEGEE